MKKIVILIGLLFLLIGCMEKPMDIDYDRISNIETIDYSELTNKLESGVDFLLYIGRPDCGDCQTFYPYLEEYVHTTGEGIYYLNIKDFRDNARKDGASQEEIDFFENLQERLSFDWTPTLSRYQNGKVVSTYKFLDLDYYQITDEQEKTKAFNQFIDDFKIWLHENYTIFIQNS